MLLLAEELYVPFKVLLLQQILFYVSVKFHGDYKSVIILGQIWLVTVIEDIARFIAVVFSHMDIYCYYC